MRLRFVRPVLASCHPLALAALVAGATVASPALTAQAAPAGTAVDGFAVRYVGPAGWTLSAREGRIHAWTDGTQRRAIVVYAGHFAPLELALGDAQRVLGVPSDEDTQVVAPLEAVTIEGRPGMAGSLRVTGAQPVTAHVAVVQLDDSTALGAVAVLEGVAPPARLDSAVRLVAGLLGSARVPDAPSIDEALRDRLTGRWAAQEVYTSTTAGAGGYTNEESWQFAADGTYAYRKRFSVSVPGADVTPEERDEDGRWYAVGNALVLVNAEGRLTVDLQFDDGVLLLDGTRFRKPDP
jgi:hypothetical protein